MIQHEITIYKCFIANHFLFTLNRDLKTHREDGPAKRFWNHYGIIAGEFYLRNGYNHREDGPAIVRRFLDGTVCTEEYRLNGKRHREGDLPALVRRRQDGTLESESYYLDGVEYDPT
jgi:hypothetical protein